MLKNNEIWGENGISNLYSKQGFQIAWKNYQTYLLNNLTLLTSGTDLEAQTVFQIMLTTNALSHQSHIFHYASQAFNNHFFFDSLSKDPSNNSSLPSRTLSAKIIENFGSFDNLKTEFLKECQSLNGNGWVFLVETENKKLKIQTLLNEGSPYFYNRNQNINLTVPSTLEEYQSYLKIQEKLNENVKEWPMPLMNVSVWDYSYNHDYGLEKRQQYFENVWNSIDWDVVSKRVFVLP